MEIAIVKAELGIGGISTSLINFLEFLNINHKNVNVDLYTIDKEIPGELPPNTNHIVIDNKLLYCSEIGKPTLVHNKQYGCFIIKCLEYVLLKIIGYRKFYNLIIGKQKIKKQYDYVISYSQDSYGVKFDKFANQYVLNKFNANQKVTFLHSDVEKEKIDFKDMENVYNQFDAIVCVSKANAKSLEKKIPNIKDKIHVEYNHFNDEKIKMLSEEYIPFEKQNDFKYFVTVGRLSKAKGIDRALEIIKKLNAKGIFNFKWFFVGEGVGDFTSDKLNVYLKENKLDQCAIFVGNKTNPYPYIAQSDYFIFPTRMEACPMVIDEAKILGTYIITCEYPAAKEQITSPNIGVVVKNEMNALLEEMIKIF